MKKHILIVEDEIEVAKSLTKFLSKAGYDVSHLESGDLVEPFLNEQKVDLILLDIMLPVMDGLTVCKIIRAKSDIPIFMLTASTEEAQKLQGLALGADDYICKPFSPSELMLRIKNFLNRFAKQAQELGLALNENEYTARYNDHIIELTKAEFEVMLLLQKHPNQTFSRDRILESIYLDYRDVSDRSVDTHVKNLRKKLKNVSASHEFIQSVYGVGYRFVNENRKRRKHDA